MTIMFSTPVQFVLFSLCYCIWFVLIRVLFLYIAPISSKRDFVYFREGIWCSS